MTLQTVLDELTNRPGTGDVISIINPVTEEQITEFTDCGEEAVNEAVARAKAAFEAGVWSELPAGRGPRSCGGSPTSSTKTPRSSPSSTR